MSGLALLLGGPARAADSAGQSAGRGRELSGKIVKVDPKNVYLEHMGAIVPMRIDENTRFIGEGVASGRDLKDGQEVRASFTVKGTTNVADRIAVEGGSRSSDVGAGKPSGRAEGTPSPDPSTAPDRLPVPRDPGSPPPIDPGGRAVPKY